LTLTIYSRPSCHLCEEMKAVVQRVRREHPFELTEVDISGDPELELRYGQEIPVLELDGKKIAKFRLDEDALRRALKGRMPGTGTGGSRTAPTSR
jgi:glutaredoxin